MRAAGKAGMHYIADDLAVHPDSTNANPLPPTGTPWDERLDWTPLTQLLTRHAEFHAYLEETGRL